MAKPTKEAAVFMDELIVSTLATADALVKILIEKGVITEVEFKKKLSAERANYQTVLQRVKNEHT